MNTHRLLFAALALGAAHASYAGDCDGFVGKGFFVVDEGVPPLNFAEKRPDGIYFNQVIPVGQKFYLSGTSPTGPDDYAVLTEGRSLIISCSQLSHSLNPSLPGQHVAQSDAGDFEHFKAQAQAREDAAAAEAKRKRAAAAAKMAQEEQARREYVAARLARGGVRVGMSQQQVLASSWGEPEKRNHNITPTGDAEQWVYPNQHFLYFINGTLTGVQTDSPDSGYFSVVH